MTDKDIKRELKNIYQPPLPQRKKEFLKSVRQSSVTDAAKQMTMCDFLFGQLQYIRPWIWGVSVIVFAAALYVMETLGEWTGWRISAMIPFVSATMVIELHRSVHYRMNELEQATRFSLKAVTYARLCILGISNFLLLAILSPFMVRMCQISPGEVIVYLLSPYALTAFLCLYILRIWHSDDNIYACAGLCIIVCLGCFLYKPLDLVTIPARIGLPVTFVLFVFMLAEGKKYFKDLEGLAWN